MVLSVTALEEGVVQEVEEDDGAEETEEFSPLLIGYSALMMDYHQ
jgi:hypothetical protein